MKDESIIGSEVGNLRPHSHATSVSAGFALLRVAYRGLSPRSPRQRYYTNAWR